MHVTYRHSFRFSANGEVHDGSYSLSPVVFAVGHLQLPKCILLLSDSIFATLENSGKLIILFL